MSAARIFSREARVFWMGAAGPSLKVAQVEVDELGNVVAVWVAACPGGQCNCVDCRRSRGPTPEWCVEAYQRVNPGSEALPIDYFPPSLYLRDFARAVLREFGSVRAV